MADWTIVEPLSGVALTLTPDAGDIEVTEVYESAVHYGLYGTTPWVTESVGRAPTITVPELVFRSVDELDQMRLLRSMSRRVVLTDRLGQEWPSRFVGPLTFRVVDAPDLARPLIYVSVSLVGVA